MIVSCLCPTFNRPPNHLHLLNEAVESFLRQRIPGGVGVELIILNDTPGQTLECSSPNVRIINTNLRYPSLGEKRNALVQIAVGDILLSWDDDDISLAGRIEQAWDRLHPYINEPAYFNPQRSWMIHGGALHHDHPHGYCHNASAFTRAAWKAAGGYPATSGNEDMLMDQRLRATASVAPPVEGRREWQYIYRWGVSPCHISGRADGPPEDPHREHYAAIGQREIVEGTFTIKPAWLHPYDQWCAARS